jgi:hypothetical protein
MSQECYGDRLMLTIHRARKLAQLIQDGIDNGITYGEMFEIEESMVIAHHRLETVVKQLDLELPPTVEKVLNMPLDEATDGE